MRWLIHNFVILLVVGSLGFPLFGQKIDIQLGPDKIGQNQAWTITVTVENSALKSHSNFPDIKGFRKGGTSSQSRTNIVHGQVSSSQSVTMRYFATQKGVFRLAPFKMKVNGQEIASSGKKIQVADPVQSQKNDPFRNFFNRDPMSNFFEDEPTEFVNIKEDAFLALTTNKNSVYVGEGFTANLSFFVADKNRAPMQFHELGKQLARMLKKLKPSNCWEENFNIEDVKGSPIRIKNKSYMQYKIYQASFYPLNEEPIRFPSVGLKMIKFKVAKSPSFFGQNRQEDYKTFYTNPKIVHVKKLPPHPLSESVSVGDYHLAESLDVTTVKTGQSIAYNFEIYGEGNVSAIKKPQLIRSEDFDFYEPNIQQSIQRMDGRVVGRKKFSYYMIPKEPGIYALGDYFKWVFFNPTSHVYDTLKSQKTIRVVGGSQKNRSIENADGDSFYDIIDRSNNALIIYHNWGWFKISINIFILLTLVASIYLFLKK